jgi:hypothetical protein
MALLQMATLGDSLRATQGDEALCDRAGGHVAVFLCDP